MSDENQNERQLPDDGSPPGHLEKMLRRKPDEQEGDSGDNNEVIGSDGEVAKRPDDIPEKFWDAEKGEVNTAALLKAQQDAEAALRKAQQGDKPDEGEGEQEGDGESDSQDTEENRANVFEAARVEFAEKGELSEDSFKALEGVGVSRDMVNAYIAGQLAIGERLTAAAFEPFGGSEEDYANAVKWAGANLSDEEIDALNVQLESNNPAIVKQGAKALLDRFVKDGDYEPPALRGNNNTTTGDVYKSRAEMIRDMGSSRYRTDAGFRKEVAEKLRRSKL